MASELNRQAEADPRQIARLYPRASRPSRPPRTSLLPCYSHAPSYFQASQSLQRPTLPQILPMTPHRSPPFLQVRERTRFSAAVEKLPRRPQQSADADVEKLRRCPEQSSSIVVEKLRCRSQQSASAAVEKLYRRLEPSASVARSKVLLPPATSLLESS
ncbi:hypothetical protein KSP40_PGU015971 [Platanthera guangdongensis]|uniref:Uncharacterized protein n=1 Tax=Platanthera guangdongensis TaxID=2320717 RepID=A0ABR2N0K1_9ASPA